MISRALMLSEIEGMQTLLGSWAAALKGEGPIPGSGGQPGIPYEDYPAPEDKRIACYQQLAGELVICAGKCETLADVIHNGAR